MVHKWILNLARAMAVLLLAQVMMHLPAVGAQRLPTESVQAALQESASEVDDEKVVNEVIKSYFKQYAVVANLKSISLLGLTIEGDRAYAVALVREPAPDGKTTQMNTTGFILERVDGDQWSIQPVKWIIPVREINLPVPFTAQVPPGDWFNSMNCGQTSAAMIFAYYGFYDHTPAAPTDITAINKWLAQAYNDQRFLDGNGYYTTTDRIAYLARNYAHFSNSYADESDDWTPDRIKQEIQAGRPVIVATYLNMDLTKPAEHLMVVRGVKLDANGNVIQVIVNDPGRSLANGHGNNYVYDVATFETVWARNNKAIVVIAPSLTPRELHR